MYLLYMLEEMEGEESARWGGNQSTVTRQSI